VPWSDPTQTLLSIVIIPWEHTRRMIQDECPNLRLHHRIDGTHIASLLIVAPFSNEKIKLGVLEQMKSRLTSILVTLGMCLALAVGIQAKTGQSKTGEAESHQMTLTGCLQQGDQPNTFTLNNASSTQTSKNKSGKAPSAMARGESTYNLVPEGSNINLQQFIGHQVRVSGYMNQSQQSSEMESSSGMNSNQFTVTSIHQTSGTCQQK
jgi:hypothetical protein